MAATKREWYNIGSEDGIAIHAAVFIGQSFTVGTVGVNEDFKITPMKIEAYRWNTIEDDLYVAIKAVDGEGKPTGPALSTGSIDPNIFGIGFVNRAWFEIEMSEYTLFASTQYCPVLSCPLAGSDYPYWCVDFSDAEYAGGCLMESIDSGSTWDKYLTYDAQFEIWGEPVMAEAKKSIGNLSARPDKEIVALL